MKINQLYQAASPNYQYGSNIWDLETQQKMSLLKIHDSTFFFAYVLHNGPRLAEDFSFRSHNEWQLTEWRPAS